MKELNSVELRNLWLKFFKKHKHKIIASASLIPENDPTVLYTTAGMHPLVPYLLGEKHPQGNRLANSQRCVRTGDIDDVGDNRHCTYFEMLGNWSLGDYFKEDMIKWSYEFLTSRRFLHIPIEKLAVTVFAGDETAPRDIESYNLWNKCGIPADKIFYLPKENNWWGLGSGVGPCGPDTEMFIDTGKEKCSIDCSPACSCGKYIEIWNDVFMQYRINVAGGPIEKLSKPNVDTGMGLERTLCILNGYKSVYDCDLFVGAIKVIEKLSGKSYEQDSETIKAFRIIADHLRAATFIMGDEKGISPSNVGQGYVLRRLIRRAINYAKRLGIEPIDLTKVCDEYIEKYKNVYPVIFKNSQKIKDELLKEINKFNKTLSDGLKEFDKAVAHLSNKVIDGKTAFRLYDTYGFPIEMTVELAAERGLSVNKQEYDEAFNLHQDLSRTANVGQFKGGLADADNYDNVRLHTASHLLLAALRKVYGNDVHQCGQNITSERLRFDFNIDHKLTPEEITVIENIVNDNIRADISVIKEEMSVSEAKKSGAMGIFEDKYGDVVSVYTIGNVSKEICGGPHVSHTGELIEFKIVKEESSSSGIRRIKATIK